MKKLLEQLAELLPDNSVLVVVPGGEHVGGIVVNFSKASVPDILVSLALSHAYLADVVQRCRDVVVQRGGAADGERFDRDLTEAVQVATSTPDAGVDLSAVAPTNTPLRILN